MVQQMEKLPLGNVAQTKALHFSNTICPSTRVIIKKWRENRFKKGRKTLSTIQEIIYAALIFPRDFYG